MIACLSPAWQPAGVAMAARSGLEKRVTALLDPRRRRLPISRTAATVLAATAAAILLSLAAINPLEPRHLSAAQTHVAAASPSTAPSENSTDSPRIFGRIEDERGRPVADAIIEAQRGALLVSTRSGVDGRFSIESEGKDIVYP